MIFEDKFIVKAPVAKVWEFLWDTEKMSVCVPGCEKIEKIDDNNFRILVIGKVSFLTARFDVKMKVTEVVPEKRLVSLVEGTDKGMAGNLKAINTMVLTPISDNETEVSYTTDFSIFGKFGALGYSVVKGKVRETSRQFADNVKSKLESAG